MTLKLRLPLPRKNKPATGAPSPSHPPQNTDLLSPKSTDMLMFSPTKAVESELFSPTSTQNLLSPKLGDDLLSPTYMDPLMSMQSIDPLMSIRSIDPLMTFRTLDPMLTYQSTDGLIPVHMGEGNLPMDRVDEQPEGTTLLDLEDPILLNVVAVLQQQGARQTVSSLRAACKRLRTVVNSTTTTLKVPSSHLSALSTSSLPDRGFNHCSTLILHHTTTNTCFPATAAAVALNLLDGTNSPPADVADNKTDTQQAGYPAKLLLTATMDNITPPGSPTGSVSVRSSFPTPRKTRKYRRGLGVCLPCLEGRTQSVDLLDFVPETPRKLTTWFLHHLHIEYNSAGLPELPELLEACKQLTLLSELSLSMDQTLNMLMEGSIAAVKTEVTEAPWQLLPSSLTFLKLDVPFWETALPKLKHLKLLKSFTGDSKSHFQDLSYLRCPLAGALPPSLESLSGVHVTTYGDVLKVAALSRLTNLEFQSLNWDWNDPIMGGPNSFNLALNLFTALKNLESLSIRHDSQSLYADEQKLEWLMRLEHLRNLELKNFKLVPRLLMPVMKQAKQLESLLLRDCVDYSSSSTLEEWPELFVHPSLKNLSLEVSGLRYTGPDVYGCLLEKSVFKCFTDEFLSLHASTSLQRLQLGQLNAEDAPALLAPLEHVINLQHLSLSLQDASFQVASVMNRLTQLERVDLSLTPEQSVDLWNPPQPDIAGFASCLADIHKFHWRQVNLPPVNIVNRNSIREAIKALKGLDSFPSIETLNVTLNIDWPVGRDLDTLHRSAFLAVCDAITHVSKVRQLQLSIHGVLPCNMNIGTPITLFSKLKMLRQMTLFVKDSQMAPINSMMKSAVQKLLSSGMPFVLYQPNVEVPQGNRFGPMHGAQFGNPFGLNTISNIDTTRAFMRAALMTC